MSNYVFKKFHPFKIYISKHVPFEKEGGLQSLLQICFEEHQQNKPNLEAYKDESDCIYSKKNFIIINKEARDPTFGKEHVLPKSYCQTHAILFVMRTTTDIPGLFRKLLVMLMYGTVQVAAKEECTLSSISRVY